MNNKIFSKKILTIAFAVLSIGFIALMALSKDFFQWTFARHQNVLSWYIRPLFIIPFCFFAFKRSGLGISITVFLMLTSMFWFPEPAVINEQVRGFLDMEKEYLTSGWTAAKVVFALVVAGSMSLLAFAFWKRSIKLGIGIMVAIAVGKVAWSAVEGGDAGLAVVVPASVGLVLCIVLVYYFVSRSKSKAKEKTAK
ncbi:MAG: hypothetical protein AB1Z23_12465 [Eubacteriales bacterium]